jgi:hypothetical protein
MLKRCGDDSVYNKVYSVGDIVYVLKFMRQDDTYGEPHHCIIVDVNEDGYSTIPYDYIGFECSSNKEKSDVANSVYWYNKEVKRKEGIKGWQLEGHVKCDHMVKINRDDILKYCGKVTDKELDKYIELYLKFNKM